MPGKFKGVFVPHVTPFTVKGDIDKEKLKKLIHFIMDSGCNGLISCGSTGEAPFLTFEERKEIIELVMDEVSGKMAVIAGTGSPSTSETLKITEEAHDLGVDAALIITPYFFKLSDKEVLEHYRVIIEKIDLPIIIYNVPKFTGYNLNPTIVTELAKEYSQVVGVKDSSGSINQISRLVESVGNKISVLAGTGETFFPTLTLGGHGGVLAIANVAPHLCTQIYKCFKAGELQKAQHLNFRLLKLNEFLVKKHNQVSCIKTALNMMVEAGGLPRKPILPPSIETENNIFKLLKETGLVK